MRSYELETRDTHETGRGGLKLPKLEVRDGDFYPHDTLRFLEYLWDMNQIKTGIGQPNENTDTGYFVVPATEDRPVIFAFRETIKGAHRYDSPLTTFQFFTTPTEAGNLQLVMSFTHRSSRNCGYAGGRDSLVLQDHEGQTTGIPFYGYRHNGVYESDEFANYRNTGEYTYENSESQESLQALTNKVRELKSLLS